MPVFQDALFSAARTIERTLENGTVLRLHLEPLAGERVKVLSYQRKATGEKWQRVATEEGRVLRYDQLRLTQAFAEIFSVPPNTNCLTA